MDITSVPNFNPVSAPADVTSAPPATPDQRALIQAIKALPSTAFGEENEFTFLIKPGSHEAIVRVINRDTKEVVLQIPAQYVVQMTEKDNEG